MNKSHAIAINFSYSSVMDYIKLMKPRVMSLVVFTSFCGLMLAPGNIHPFIAFVAMLCITLGSGAAAAINMWYDRDIDAIMKRTQNRPIVIGAINPDEALAFGIVLAVISTILMTLCVNLMAGLLLVTTILYYILIYTVWLKRSSPQNVVIGGAAGAFPPMIGWAAVTGDISVTSFVLFIIIFLWTPPHSWALAIYRLQDYKDCKVPMMPVINGIYYTKKLMLFYSILMFISSILPFFIGLAGIQYLIVTCILNVIFFYYSIDIFKDDAQNTKAKRLFFYSILYLFAIFLLLLMKA